MPADVQRAVLLWKKGEVTFCHLQLSPPPQVLASLGNGFEVHEAEESRALGLGVRPIVHLGNCALMTSRSPLGFREVHFRLPSPESPQLLCRGATLQKQKERIGFNTGESVPLVNKTNPRWSRNVTPHSSATSDTPKQSIAPQHVL